MSFPFGPAPTLGEFVAKATQHGVSVKHNPAVIDGPNGSVRFSYLWIDTNRFAPLPDMGYDEPLAPDMVGYLARRPGIAVSEFWPGFDGFNDPNDENPPPPNLKDG